MLNLSDEDLLVHLSNYEDPFVERKVHSDIKDVLKTAVAFANSLPRGAPGVLFIPAKNDGTIQDGYNLDELQIKISAQINKAYPPIKYIQKIVCRESRQVVAVIIWGSDTRPHFAGPAFIRDGSQTLIASEAQFTELVSSRLSQVSEILKWKSKIITVEFMRPPQHAHIGRSVGKEDYTVEECNQFYITLKQASSERYVSFTLSRLLISFDQEKHRLLLEVAH